MKNKNRERIMIVGAILLLILCVGMARFFNEKKQKTSGKSLKTEENSTDNDNNDENLLQYAAKWYVGQTYAAFFDLTGDGLDELLVFCAEDDYAEQGSDEEYDYSESDGMVEVIYIYSRTDAGEIIEMDKMFTDPYDAFYLCEEDGKYCLFWEDVEEMNETWEEPNNVIFYQILYDEERRKRRL